MFKNKYVLLVLAMVLLLGTMLVPGQLKAAAPDGYTLVWSDECNGAANTAVDSSKWNLVHSGGGFGNAELQYYTNRLANSYYDGNGNLIIKAMKEAYSGYDYTSAKLYSQNKGDWQYCFIEIRAKITRGRCVWLAFWMMPTASSYGGWPVCGEIDIMENRGDQTTKIGGAIHFGNPWLYLSGDYFLPSGEFYTDYHLFQIKWLPGEFRWYVNGNLYQTRVHTQWYCSAVPESTNPYALFDQLFYLQLNVAIGGPGTPFTGNQNPDDSALPQYMYIDYVRVYQKESYPTPTPIPTPLPVAIPGQIEAKNWNAMSGVQTETTSDTGGGLNVGWIDAGDWMDYNVDVNPAGTYLAYRVASPNTTGTFDLKKGSTVLGSYTVPQTGGWQAWTTISGKVSLSSGVQTLRIAVTGTGWNINWMKFSQGSGPTPTPIPTPTAGPTSTPTPTPTPGGVISTGQRTITQPLSIPATDLHFIVYQADRSDAWILGWGIELSTPFTSIHVTPSQWPFTYGIHSLIIDIEGINVPYGTAVDIIATLNLNTYNTVKFADIKWTYANHAPVSAMPADIGWAVATNPGSSQGGWLISKYTVMDLNGKPVAVDLVGHQFLATNTLPAFSDLSITNGTPSNPGSSPVKITGWGVAVVPTLPSWDEINNWQWDVYYNTPIYLYPGQIIHFPTPTPTPGPTSTPGPT